LFFPPTAKLNGENHSGVPRNDEKSACGTGTVFRENRGRASGIVGPRDVIEAEIDAALNWTQDPPGGSVYVAQLQPRAVREVS
jgi:hypothetical protein